MSLFNRAIMGAIFLSWLLCNNLPGQSNVQDREPVKLTFYYNSKWELTTPEKSFYRREAFFDLNNMVFDGIYSDYNTKGKLITDGSYYHGMKSGIHSEYDTTLTIKSKIEYTNDSFTIWEWNGGADGVIKNGSGKFTMRYYYFVELDTRLSWKQGLMSGEFENGKRIGRWTYYDLQHVKTDEEVYSRGKFVKRTHYSTQDSIETHERKPTYLSLVSLNTEVLTHDKESFTSLNQYFEKYIKYPSTFQRNVSYPGGIKRLISLMTQMVYIKDRDLCVIHVIIDEHGQVAKAEVVRSINPASDKRILEAFLLHDKRLVPAIKNGKPYETEFFLPISGGREWARLLEEMPDEWFLDPNNFLN